MKITFMAWAVLVLAVWQPLAQPQKPPVFDVASVKPHPGVAGPGTMMRETAGSVNYIGIPLMSVIARAWDVAGMQVVGPSWIYSDTYDIKAAFPRDAPATQIPLMLQGLLAERFQLAVHHEQRELAAYVMVVAKGGVKMHPSEGSRTGSYRPYGDAEGRNIRGRITMPNLAGYLSYQVGGPVSDKTGLDGVYDITLDFAVDQDSATPLVFTALQEQRGLKLESKKAPVDMIIVDHAEKGSNGELIGENAAVDSTVSADSKSGVVY